MSSRGRNAHVKWSSKLASFRQVSPRNCEN